MEDRMQKDYTKSKLKKSGGNFVFEFFEYFQPKIFIQFFDRNTENGGDATHRGVGGHMEQLTRWIQVRSGLLR